MVISWSDENEFKALKASACEILVFVPTTTVMQTTAGIDSLLITRQSSLPFPFRGTRLLQKEGRWGFDYLHWVTIQTQRHHSANWVRNAVTVTADTNWLKWGTVFLQPPRAAIINPLMHAQPMKSNKLQSTGLIRRHFNMNVKTINQNLQLDQTYLL